MQVEHKMMRYEELSKKIQDCIDVAKKTTGNIQVMWYKNASDLIEARGNLTIEQAEVAK